MDVANTEIVTNILSEINSEIISIYDKLQKLSLERQRIKVEEMRLNRQLNTLKHRRTLIRYK